MCVHKELKKKVLSEFSEAVESQKGSFQSTKKSWYSDYFENTIMPINTILSDETFLDISSSIHQHSEINAHYSSDLSFTQWVQAPRSITQLTFFSLRSNKHQRCLAPPHRSPKIEVRQSQSIDIAFVISLINESFLTDLTEDTSTFSTNWKGRHFKFEKNVLFLYPFVGRKSDIYEIIKRIVNGAWKWNFIIVGNVVIGRVGNYDWTVFFFYVKGKE